MKEALRNSIDELTEFRDNSFEEISTDINNIIINIEYNGNPDKYMKEYTKLDLKNILNKIDRMCTSLKDNMKAVIDLYIE